MAENKKRYHWPVFVIIGIIAMIFVIKMPSFMTPAPKIPPPNTSSPMSVTAKDDWTPAQLANLAIWLKADAGVYSDAGATLASDTDTIQEWHDQSDNGYVFSQTTESKKPVWNAVARNGLPAVDCDATDDIMIHATDILLNGQTGYVFAAFTLDALQDFLTIIGSADNDVATQYWLATAYKGYKGDPYMTIFNYSDTTGQNIILGTTKITTGAYLMGWASNGLAYRMRLNGTEEPVVARQGSNDGDWLADIVGRDNVSVPAVKFNGGAVEDWLDGDLYEIIVVDGVELTESDIARIEHYLNKRWAIY